MSDVLLVALISLVAVQLGHLVNNLLQSRLTNSRILSEKKREVYFKYITSFNKSILGARRGEPPGPHDDFMSATAEVMLIAPDNVIKAMVDARRSLLNMTPDDLKNPETVSLNIMKFFGVIREMRQDCRGELTKITPEELRLVIKRAGQ